MSGRETASFLLYIFFVRVACDFFNTNFRTCCLLIISQEFSYVLRTNRGVYILGKVCYTLGVKDRRLGSTKSWLRARASATQTYFLQKVSCELRAGSSLRCAHPKFYIKFAATATQLFFRTCYVRKFFLTFLEKSFKM